MIAALHGTWRGGVVHTGGVGYAVATAEHFADGTQVELHVTTIWRDSGPSLYGFTSTNTQEVFNALCKVTRVGPAMALSVLRTLGTSGCISAIRERDAKRIATAPGVGAKAAELIVNLTKLDDELSADDGGTDSEYLELVGALEALGYDRREADLAVRGAVDAGVAGEEEILKVALESLRGNV
jgi:Holliday junction DNA helicase RuvA